MVWQVHGLALRWMTVCVPIVHDSSRGVDRHASVILLDASPAQLARWVVHAVQAKRGKIDPG
jgi:hypothetical protein